MDTVFEQGQTHHNLNGSDYRVMEKLSDRNLLLMDIKTGNFVVAQGTNLFARHPRGVEATENNSLMGIEWGQVLYLGSTPSTIDFRHIRQEYGTKRTTEDIYHFRVSLDFLVCGCEKKAEIDSLLAGVNDKEVQFVRNMVISVIENIIIKMIRSRIIL